MSTFNSAGNGVFSLCKNTDNQHCYDCANSTAFTGKERDGETGYSYFGARYYDSDLFGFFLSVDPMSDKYTSISPYAYCAWNPVKLVDPDGAEIDDYFSYDGKYLGTDNAETNNVRIINETTWNLLPKNDYGLVDHDIAYSSSMSFSKSSTLGMSVDAQLSVYNHYNTTGYSVVKSSENNSSTAFRTVVGYDSKKETTTIRLEVFLETNVRKKICDNADEIINSYIHESDHIEKAKTFGYHEYKKLQENSLKELEQSALNAQMSDPTWFRTRNYFKRGVINYVNGIK